MKNEFLLLFSLPINRNWWCACPNLSFIFIYFHQFVTGTLIFFFANRYLKMSPSLLTYPVVFSRAIISLNNFFFRELITNFLISGRTNVQLGSIIAARTRKNANHSRTSSHRSRPRLRENILLCSGIRRNPVPAKIRLCHGRTTGWSTFAQRKCGEKRSQSGVRGQVRFPADHLRWIVARGQYLEQWLASKVTTLGLTRPIRVLVLCANFRCFFLRRLFTPIGWRNKLRGCSPR